jgi:hypothetical protein
LPSNKLLVLSGSTKLRFNSVVNHKAYADEWGYGYHFDLSPIRELASPFFTKIEILLGQLKPNGPEWVFWIDDDAYFTDFSKPLHSFLSECESSTDLVFCESPKNQSGEWTWMSSGQFFLRNSERSRRLLKAVLETPLSSVREWWDPGQFGLFTGADQDVLVFLLNEWADFEGSYSRLDYSEFNSRPFHYERQLDEHFLVHFVGGKDKERLRRDLVSRLGCNRFLVPEHLLDPYQAWIEVSNFPPRLGIGDLLRKIVKRFW